MQHPTHSHRFSRWTSVGSQLIWLLEIGGLIIIAIATLMAGAFEVEHMYNKHSIDLADLLLLFLYLEILAMVSIYLQSGALPVRLPMFIAIVAMARYVIIDAKSMDEFRILAITGGIFIITLAILTLNYAESRLAPTQKQKDADT